MSVSEDALWSSPLPTDDVIKCDTSNSVCLEGAHWQVTSLLGGVSLEVENNPRGQSPRGAHTSDQTRRAAS